MFSLLETMFVAYGEKQTGYELKMLSCFYQLEYLLVTRYRKLEVGEEILKNNKHLKRLGRITGYLKEHYTEDVSLEKLAGILVIHRHISPGCFKNMRRSITRNTCRVCAWSTP